jgi:hypothetical protein
MSALPPKADISRTSRHVRFVPKPDERQRSKKVLLFDHLVSQREQLIRYFESKTLCGLLINDEIEFRGLHDGQITWLCAL